MSLILACTPESARNTRTTSTESENTETTDTTDEVDTDDNPISWIASGQTVTGSLTQNSDDQASIYIQGSGINNYLVSSSLTNEVFCLVSNFRTSTGTTQNRQLRFRAIPTRLTSTGKYVLRVDVAISSDNQSFCGGDGIPFIEATGNQTTTISSSNAVFTYAEVCPTCTLSLTSLSLQLYQSNSGQISATSLVPNTSIDLAGLGLKLDVTSSSPSVGGSCSNSACSAQGFDCCLDGQCVDDGAIRSNPDVTQLTLALLDIQKDPLNFKKWPTVFYVCSTDTGATPPGGDDDDDSDPVDDANQQLQADIKDYNCLQGDTTQCDPDLLSVQQRTWKKCGCLLDPITNDPLDPRCPDYTLDAEKDNNGTITKVVCKIPPAETDPTPIQNLDINISARRAPHRFYSSTGVNYDDLSKVPAGTVQEGIEFSYLDDINKVGPVSTSYNMNAVLGQFAVSLDQALPAQVINIEMDQSYIISGTSGYFSPCPTCQKDPWYVAFSSVPSSILPHGNTWKGYTTERGAYGNNANNGNYEDMIFNRACWLPPTMLPYSHMPNATLTTQRTNRLTAQAAMYVNGYQRDWFGFNKGALIASFDGVSWFAVGNGRRVRSTTNKLFLAINAPYADLTDPTNYEVSVVQDLGGQSASDHDYDFDIAPNASGQNPGASCQYMHQCNTDSDCVAKLGWEYACADVEGVKSNWPRFNGSAEEKANDEFTNIGLDEILAGGINNPSIKRCVYRGAGALCKTNYASDLTENQQKLLKCAPNFYCAQLDSSSFNTEVKRSPNDPTNILFGQDANILGRPKNYVGALNVLPDAAIDNIVNNAKNYYALADKSNFGLCRPGKDVTGSAAESVRHAVKDAQNRTDYINQISACDSSATGDGRVIACPAFDADGNFDNSSTITAIRHNQNMCGGESLKSDGTSLSFSDIEKDDLSSILSINTPSLAKNACFRRAGSVCHTNLDCAPNYLHSEAAATLGQEDFGDTLAELQFWQEELVCGQAQEEPLLNSSSSEDYYSYDMGKNRCCREVTKDFTMYTQFDANSQNAGALSENEKLNTDLFPHSNPGAEGRYSRYASSSSNVNVRMPDSATFDTNQWETINDTGSLTCCGGGFIRKFEDGTNNWNNPRRLQMTPENFSCINYRDRLYKERPSNITNANWQFYYNSLCLYPATENDSVSELIGCIQENIESEFVSNNFKTPTPFTAGSLEFTTYPGNDAQASNMTIDESVAINTQRYYPAKAFTNGIWDPSQRASGTFTNTTEYVNQLLVIRDDADFDASSVNENDKVIAMIIPSFIPTANITAVDIVVKDGENNTLTLPTGDGAPAWNNTVPVGTCDIATIKASGGWCITNALSGAGGKDVLLAGLPSDGVDDPDDANSNWQWAFFNVTYNANLPDGSMEPGSDQYYLDRLSRFELLGVPQIGYQPIFCNDSENASDTTYTGSATDDNEGLELVPGIFSVTTQEGFSKRTNLGEASPVTPSDDSVTDAADGTISSPRLFYKEDGSTIELPKVFSANDFKCCSKLGSTVNSVGRCCSGHGVSTGNGQFTCKLPKGTNLNVYLNKFISSEADTIDETLKISSTEEDSSGATTYNFDRETGFPVYTTEVQAKVRAIGEAYCESGNVRSGNAFGYFPPAPSDFSYIGSPEVYYSIIDSVFDFDQEDNTRGYSTFLQGYRWNHHIYCE